jgi:hypothetical protein
VNGLLNSGDNPNADSSLRGKRSTSFASDGDWSPKGEKRSDFRTNLTAARSTGSSEGLLGQSAVSSRPSCQNLPDRMCVGCRLRASVLCLLLDPFRARAMATQAARSPKKKPKTRHNRVVRPDSYGPSRLSPLTYEGEVAHEADDPTVGCGPQPQPNLSSPECPTRGLPQGGKPTFFSKPTINSGSLPRGRKTKRVSESKLHGTVNCKLAALLMRVSESSRAVGPSMRAVHGGQESRRSCEQNPSLSHVEPSELGHVVRRSVAGNRNGGASRPDYARRVNRCVTGSKG